MRLVLTGLVAALAVAGLPAAASAAVPLHYVGTVVGSLGSAARAVDVGADGTIYVLNALADTQNVTVYDSRGTRVRSFGAAGAGPGEFRDARDLAVDSQGDVYVADAGNRRIQKFSPSGQLLDATWSGQPAQALDVGPNDDVYVDNGYGKFFEFAPDGRVIVTRPTLGSDLAVAPTGNVLSIIPNEPVDERDASGRHVNNIGTVVPGTPAPDQWSDGGPSSIAVGADGVIWTGDYADGRIQRFASSGAFLGACGHSLFRARFVPLDVAVGADGDGYVLEPSGVARFTASSSTGPGCVDREVRVTQLHVRAAARHASRPRDLDIATNHPARIVLSLMRTSPRPQAPVRVVVAGYHTHAHVNLSRLQATRHLAPGRYRATVAATDAYDNRSPPRSLLLHLYSPAA